MSSTLRLRDQERLGIREFSLLAYSRQVAIFHARRAFPVAPIGILKGIYLGVGIVPNAGHAFGQAISVFVEA